MPDSKLPWGLILGEVLILVIGVITTFSDGKAAGTPLAATQSAHSE